jgi:two-component system phosphate regulon sensor histidine kinase PhoR
MGDRLGGPIGLSHTVLARTTDGADAVEPAVANAILAEMASHDLREPVHAIQGFLSVLLSGKAGSLTPLQHEFVVSMFVSSRRLERLINDIQVILARERDFSILEEEIDLVEYLRACSVELSGIYPDAGSRISIVADSPSQNNPTPFRIRADPMRIEQIFLNTIDNALRYADLDSPIDIRMRSTRSRILCVVENRAVRLADEDPKRWLIPFTRGRGSAEKAGGRGLGLTVVDHLVRLHRGGLFLRRRGTMVAIGFVLPRDSRSVDGDAAGGSADDDL